MCLPGRDLTSVFADRPTDAEVDSRQQGHFALPLRTHSRETTPASTYILSPQTTQRFSPADMNWSLAGRIRKNLDRGGG